MAEKIKVIQELSRNAVIQAKNAIDRGIGQSVSQGLIIESGAYKNVLRSADRMEGLKAFIEKRKPVFQNK